MKKPNERFKKLVSTNGKRVLDITKTEGCMTILLRAGVGRGYRLLKL